MVTPAPGCAGAEAVADVLPDGFVTVVPETGGAVAVVPETGGAVTAVPVAKVGRPVGMGTDADPAVPVTGPVVCAVGSGDSIVRQAQAEAKNAIMTVSGKMRIMVWKRLLSWIMGDLWMMRLGTGADGACGWLMHPS